MKCRHCRADLALPFVDLGCAPLSNAYLTKEALGLPEKRFPLRVLVCTGCWLVQTEDFAGREEIFNSEYAYFSGYSSSWLMHCERYVAGMVERFKLNADSHVVEVAANDGYLLQYFNARGIPCLGIEPTASTAAAARGKGIAIVEDFFGTRLARELAGRGQQADLNGTNLRRGFNETSTSLKEIPSSEGSAKRGVGLTENSLKFAPFEADLMVANNVLAHVPDINDFVSGITILLKPHGVATFEFPHLMRLVEESQFDTIYHEHFSYLSFHTVKRIFEQSGLNIFDVEELSTHGGSLRVFAQRSDNGVQAVTTRVAELLKREADAGMMTAGYYAGFQAKADKVKNDLLAFLLEARRGAKKVAAYGAAAKGNTLLNYAGVRSDLLPYVVDRNPAKQGKYLPGSHIPIVDESRILEFRPDYVIILPWNIHDEVMKQLSYIRDWGGKFVKAVPELDVLD